MDASLAGLKRDQSPDTVVGDADNSVSMRWDKSVANGTMNHASGANCSSHPTAITWVGKGSGVD